MLLYFSFFLTLLVLLLIRLSLLILPMYVLYRLYFSVFTSNSLSSSYLLLCTSINGVELPTAVHKIECASTWITCGGVAKKTKNFRSNVPILSRVICPISLLPQSLCFICVEREGLDQVKVQKGRGGEIMAIIGRNQEYQCHGRFRSRYPNNLSSLKSHGHYDRHRI